MKTATICKALDQWRLDELLSMLKMFSPLLIFSRQLSPWLVGFKYMHNNKAMCTNTDKQLVSLLSLSTWRGCSSLLIHRPEVGQSLLIKKWNEIPHGNTLLLIKLNPPLPPSFSPVFYSKGYAWIHFTSVIGTRYKIMAARVGSDYQCIPIGMKRKRRKRSTKKNGGLRLNQMIPAARSPHQSSSERRQRTNGAVTQKMALTQLSFIAVQVQ